MPIVAAVAVLEPHTAANPAQAPTVAMASPPRKCPSHLWAESYRRWLMPEAKANCPIRIKRGMTL